MFWFAIFVVVAGGYQAAVVGDLPPACSLFTRQLASEGHSSASSVGVPPTPYLEPITANTPRTWPALGDTDGAEPGLDTLGAINVQSPAKVLYLADGRFLLHEHGKAVLRHRPPDSLLSASWLIISKQFGTVHLQALNNKGGLRWLSCNLLLVRDISDACLFWMTAAQWDHWSSSNVGQYVLKRHIDEGMFLSAAPGSSKLTWSHTASAFHVADWVPEACPLQGMTPSPHSYNDAKGEVTFTMTTFFKVYARSIMFRQALSSVFMYLKERDFYIREFLVINDWYDGRALNFNGTFSGPGIHESRREMLAFFPGCEGTTVEAARHRPASQKCSFIFKDATERGQPKALNILLDLMVTKFWIQFEDDHVFYQDVYVSRLLAPMYEDVDSCWNYEKRQELLQQQSAFPAVAPVEPVPTAAAEPESPLAEGRPGARTQDDDLARNGHGSHSHGHGHSHSSSSSPSSTSTSTTRMPSSSPSNARAVTDGSGGLLRRRTVDGDLALGRRLAEARRPCTIIGSVRLGSRPPFGGLGGEDFFEVEKYQAPKSLFNSSYIRELLAHGGFDYDKEHGWGAFGGVGAVRWPPFSLRPSLHNLTYIRSLEAPLFYEGEPGHFSEDPNITRWRDNGKTYSFHWDFELEFAVRWARKGATTATISPGACMRDVSNGISSFERSVDKR